MERQMKSGINGRPGKWLAIAASVMAAAPAVTFAQQPSYEELQKRIEQLESRLGQIDQKDNTKQVDATVNAVLKDAEKRSHLLADGAGLSAGYDKGFFIRSDDGNFLLKPAAIFQFRGVANSNDAG